MSNAIWNSDIHTVWLAKEQHYYNLVKQSDIAREHFLENIQADVVKEMNANEFYDFLFDEYFVWKYTAKNRLATTRNNLLKHKENLLELKNIHSELFSFDLNNIEYGLKIACRINGLGIAGASGLLSILFPNFFGTVDQFVVLRLREFEEFKNNSHLHTINENGLKLKDGVLLTAI